MSRSALAEGLRHLRGVIASQRHRDDSDEELLHAFAAERDDSAFATLVRRHGPMVLHVCRRVLGHQQDAEDAFQATFLVLARNTYAVRKKSSLASFLHGTAYRLSLSAKRAAARRRKHERQIPARPAVDPAEELSWREVRTLLDAEISRLPDSLRGVFVLCYLENLSQAEAGQRLGLKERTVSDRLAEARKRLSQRLSRRGVELTAVLAAASLATPPASALSAGLLATTVKAALAEAAGEKLAGVVSASVVELVQSASAAMMMSKAKIVTVVLLAMTMLTGASVWAYRGVAVNALPSSAQPVEPLGAKRDEKKAASPKSETVKTVEIKGRVLDPEGKPKAGAKLVFVGEKGDVKQLGVTAADGRFTVVVPKTVEGRGLSPALLARSDDAGLDFIRLARLDAAKPLELRLVKDQVIRGRIVNTEGKPIAAVRVGVTNIHVYANNSLETFLILWQRRPADHALPPGEKTAWFRGPALLSAITDKDGRFSIAGVGVERVAELDLRGDGIATTSLWIGNREGFDWKPYNRPADDVYRLAPKRMNPEPLGTLLQGPDASIIAEPEKPIRGTVKDADSGKGIPNVVVRLQQSPTDVWRNFPTAKSDAQGRYEFHGARKTKTYPFHVDSDSKAGYLATQITLADTVGYSPLNVDIRIKKGVIVTGKIIDKATGKSVPGFAQFEILVNNPFVKDYPHVSSGNRANTAADGTFRVAVIPGPVLLMGGYYPTTPTEKFDYIEFSKYRTPIADPEYPQYFSKLPGDRDTPGYNASGGGIGLIQGNYCKVLDIKPGTAVVHQDILLERASILEVKIQDTDGRPIAGVWATDFATHGYIGPLWIDRSTCPVYGLEQRKSRMLIFYEPKKKIIGSRKLQGDEKGPLVVKLGAMGAIEGRLLDSDGKPLSGVAVAVHYREREAEKMNRDILHEAKQIITDASGAFTINELIPELKFELTVQRGKRRFERETKSADSTIQVKPGENRDLGTIRVKSITAKADE